MNHPFEDPRHARRDFLRFGAGALGAFGLGWPLAAQGAPKGRPKPRAQSAEPDEKAPGTLVLVQLSGGNDGLSTLIPYADDDYHRVRPTLRLEPSEVLRLDERRGFHPALARLRSRFDQGGLALVEGVGYPEPNRSHFKSLDVWHAADPRGRRVGTGWIGRLAELEFPADPLSVIHVGASVPFSLVSALRPPTAFLSPSAYRRLGFDGAVEPEAGQESRSASGSDALEHVLRTVRDARSSSERLRAAVEGYRPRAEYPDDGFAAGLRTIAALIEARVGARVLSIELSGFDTHNDQRRRHDRLMETLDAGLGAFLADLDGSEAGRGTLVLAFSEFGRRVAENGSRGTDHGTAGPVLVAGPKAKAGLHGKSASLGRLRDDDLVHTTDFRSVYATAIDALFETGHEQVLGQRWPILPFA